MNARLIPFLLVPCLLVSTLQAIESNEERKSRQALEKYHVEHEYANEALKTRPAPHNWEQYQATMEDANVGLDFLRFQLNEFYRVTQKDPTHENERAFELLDQIVETNEQMTDLIVSTLKPLNRQKVYKYTKDINFFVSELCWALHCCDWKKLARDLKRLSAVSRAYRKFYCKAMCLEEPYWKACFGICEGEVSL